MADKYGITLQERIIAEKNGISYMTLRRRIANYGWDKEKAINTPLQNNGTVKRFMEIAESNGISKYTFRMRIYKLGWSLKKASTEPVREKYRGVKA